MNALGSAQVEADSRPRLLYLTWRDLGHPEAGGAEVFFDRTAQALHEAGWAVDVVTASYPGACPREQALGGSHRRLGHRYTVYGWAALHLLRHSRRYQAVIDVQNGVPFFARLLTRAPVLLVVHHVHREQWTTFFGPTVARIGWWVESRLSVRVHRHTAYLTVSQASRDDLISLGVDPARIRVIYSGVDLPSAEYCTARHPDPTLVVLGRLVPHKRVEIAIDALAALSDRHPRARLVVIGDGYWLGRLEQHALRRGVSDRITFTGYVDDATKHALLSEAWVSLLPSTKEGWGLAIIEAGLHGTPTVAFRDAGGTAESIHDGQTGLLVNTPDEFISATDALLTDGEQREKLGSAARDFACSLSWTATAAGVCSTIAEIGRRDDRIAVSPRRRPRSPRRPPAESR